MVSGVRVVDVHGEPKPCAECKLGLTRQLGLRWQPIKGTYFFAGNWRNGVQWYELAAGANNCRDRTHGAGSQLRRTRSGYALAGYARANSSIND